MRDRASGRHLQGLRHHRFGRELLTDLAIFNLDILALLVPVDQLLDRAGQILVGRDHGHQLANVEAATNCEVAANEEEQKWGQLG